MRNRTLRRPRHVAFVSPAWPPDCLANGIVTYVANMRQGLQQEGVSSLVLAWVPPDAPQNTPDVVPLCDANIQAVPAALLRTVRRVSPWSLTGHQHALRVLHALQRLPGTSRPELIEMEESFGTPFWAQPFLDIPIVVRLHGPWFLAGPSDNVVQDAAFARRVWAEGQAFRAALAITSPARDQLERVRARYQVELPHAAVIPNPGPSVEARERWSYQACDKKTLLCVGRFDLRKGADLVVKAFRRLGAELPELELLLVGPGEGIPVRGELLAPERYLDGELPGELRARARWLGSRPLSEIAELRRRSFVTVVASRYENHPLAVLEALAYGCPLVASRTGGIPEIVQEGRNGVLFQSESEADLAEACLRLLRDPQHAQRMGAEGARAMQNDYSPRAVARLTLDYYTERLERWHRMSASARLAFRLRTLVD
ncbi:MAG: glycosyltransferase family 4 protein [Myxococcales bacterium]